MKRRWKVVAAGAGVWAAKRVQEERVFAADSERISRLSDFITCNATGPSQLTRELLEAGFAALMRPSPAMSRKVEWLEDSLPLGAHVACEGGPLPRRGLSFAELHAEVTGAMVPVDVEPGRLREWLVASRLEMQQSARRPSWLGTFSVVQT